MHVVFETNGSLFKKKTKKLFDTNIAKYLEKMCPNFDKVDTCLKFVESIFVYIKYGNRIL